MSNIIMITADTNIETLLGIESSPEDFTGEELATMGQITAQDIAAGMSYRDAQTFHAAFNAAHGVAWFDNSTPNAERAETILRTWSR